MFQRLEVKVRQDAPAAHLDIVMLVRAGRHVAGGEVGDGGELGIEHGAPGALLLLQRGHVLLQGGNFGLQRLGRGAVLLRHGLADQLGGLVAAALHLLQAGGEGAPLLVHGQQAGGKRIEPAAGEGSVESGGVFADQA